VVFTAVFASGVTIGSPGAFDEEVIAVGGSVFKRCGCREAVTGRLLGARCPDLVADGHGSWFFSLELPSGADGKRCRLRRGGYPTECAAVAALEPVG
jgi:hypothetical protein